MKPIQEILSRIRWDKEYAKADFIIGYYDRVDEEIVLVPFREIYFDAEDHFAFQVIDKEGTTHNIPLHRVKAIYRNQELIWHRNE